MKKLINFSVGLLGLLMITGCGDSLDISDCEAPATKIYTVNLSNSEFDRLVNVKLIMTDGCNVSTGKDIQSLNFTYDDIYTFDDEEQGFLENLVGYSDSYDYQLDFTCETIGEMDYIQQIEPVFDELDDELSCNLIIDSSNNSQDLDLDFTLVLESEQ